MRHDITPRVTPVQRNKCRGSDYYYIQVYEGSRIRWKSLKTKSKKEAQAYCDRVNGDRFYPKQEIRSVDMQVAVFAFFRSVEVERQCVAGTVKSYTEILTELAKEFGIAGVRKVEDVTPQLASDYVAGKLASNSGSTIRTKLTIIKQFFNWAIDNFMLSIRNPFAKIRGPKRKPSIRKFWTVEQCEAIIAAAGSQETAAFFAFMAFAGLRVSEAQRLKLSDLHGNALVIQGKGGKIARLPISQPLQNIVSAWLAKRGSEAGYLFPSYCEKIKPPVHALLRAVKIAGLAEDKPVHYHRFRHSYGSNLIRANVNIKAVQTLMRHKNIVLTMDHYGHLLDSDVREAAEMLWKNQPEAKNDFLYAKSPKEAE